MDFEKMSDGDLDKALQDVQGENQTRMAGLMASDPPVRLDPAGVVMAKLTTFIECTLTDRQRREFELAFEQKMTGVLKSAQAQQRAAQLTHGVQTAAPGGAAPVGKLFIPGVNA